MYERAADCWNLHLHGLSVQQPGHRDISRAESDCQTTVPEPEYEKIIKDPYVLEFLDLLQNEHFYESELEQALIDHLQKFLLELGRGFSFVARQKHFNIDGRHFLPSDAQKVSYLRRP